MKAAGYKAGRDILLALDVAASELYSNKKYVLAAEKKSKLSSDEMIDFIARLTKKYPIVSVEDGLAENDWKGWKQLTAQLGEKVQIVGDDVFVTNTEILAKGIKEKVGNSILIKVNQIGTLTETLDAVEMAKRAMKSIISSELSLDFFSAANTYFLLEYNSLAATSRARRMSRPAL